METKLYSPKEIAALLRMTPQGARNILHSRVPQYTINQTVVKFKVIQLGKRLFVAEETHARIVELLRK